jgi:hypothetical protein
MRGVWQRKFRNSWGERVQKKEKWWRDLDVRPKREKTGIGWKERKEGAECAMRRERRQLSTCGLDVVKWERDRMEFGEILNEDGREIRWMKEEGKNRNRKGWGIEIKMYS